MEEIIQEDRITENIVKLLKSSSCCTKRIARGKGSVNSGAMDQDAINNLTSGRLKVLGLNCKMADL